MRSSTAATAFSRSLRTLHGDSYGPAARGLLIAVCFAGAWAAWCSLAKITLYEVTDTARLEVNRAIYPVQASMAGRVVSSALLMGREVKAGEILVELDAEPEKLQIREQRAKLAALTPTAAALRAQIEAEQQARIQEQQAARVSSEQAGASAREAAAPAAFAEDDAHRLSQLRADGLIAEREYLRSKADAEKFRAAAEGQKIAIRRIEQEQRTREGDRATRIRGLETDISRIESQIPEIQAAIRRLEYDVERRVLRSPVSGKLGEAAILGKGSVLREGDKICTILPDGRLAVTAQFPPPAALGRIRPGQTAKLRLNGFPWTQYGSITATVSKVADEVRDGTVRVEFQVDAAQKIPLQHGLPGTVEVRIEQVTPLALVLRNAGQMLTEPRSAF